MIQEILFFSTLTFQQKDLEKWILQATKKENFNNRHKRRKTIK